MPGSFQHLAISDRNMQESVDFYTRLFGLSMSLYEPVGTG